MGKKSKKGTSRAKAHYGKAKRAAQRSAGSLNRYKSDSFEEDRNHTAETVDIAKEEVTLTPSPPAAAVVAKVEESSPPVLATKDKAPQASAAAAVAVDVKEESSLEENLNLLTPSQQTLAKTLSSMGQSHLFSSWSKPGTNDDLKKDLLSKLERMDAAYPSNGLAGYISNARELLEKSRRGENPLEGWAPSVPQGEMFEIGTKDFWDCEAVGMKEIGKCGFALVAGGLGERLGYSGIKLGLPTEISTETCYLQLYIETILAIQSRYAPPGTLLPLCIMVSNDTNAGTIKLLESNNYFGMKKEQITIVQQGDGVPALMDNDATIAKADDYHIQAKPHGHGDIHALLHSHGVAKKWVGQGLQWMIFFQDTNGLAFHTLALALGVSKKRDLIMNSIAVPRKAKQAVGGITKLTKSSTGEERTINVEYNQLDPLLQANGSPDGDVNDEKTGFSPFPGNINQLLFQLKPYTAALEKTKGAMPEFVNPKYADAEKTKFKKPTRLECMMQDFPTVLHGEDAKRVGFTSIAADVCFSPVKNATSDGVSLQKKGTAPGVAASGEADQYAAIRRIMTSIGCQVEEGKSEEYSGIEVVPGPEIVLKPSFTICPTEYKEKFPQPSKIKISGRSSLVVSGSGVIIESLDLDGALVIECEDGASGIIKDLSVKNKGWMKAKDVSGRKEYIRIRGYSHFKTETKKIIFRKDGSTEGYESPEPVKEKAPTPKPEPVKVTFDDNKNGGDLNQPNTPEAIVSDASNGCCCIC